MPADVDQLERIPALGHRAGLDAAGGADEMDLAAAGPDLLGEGDAGEQVPAGAAAGDHHPQGPLRRRRRPRARRRGRDRGRHRLAVAQQDPRQDGGFGRRWRACGSWRPDIALSLRGRPIGGAWRCRCASSWSARRLLDADRVFHSVAGRWLSRTSRKRSRACASVRIRPHAGTIGHVLCSRVEALDHVEVRLGRADHLADGHLSRLAREPQDRRRDRAPTR